MVFLTTGALQLGEGEIVTSEIFEVGRFAGLLNVSGQNFTFVVQIDKPRHALLTNDFLIFRELNQTVLKQNLLALVVVKIEPFFAGFADTIAYLLIIRAVNELCLR